MVSTRRGTFLWLLTYFCALLPILAYVLFLEIILTTLNRHFRDVKEDNSRDNAIFMFSVSLNATRFPLYLSHYGI